MRSLIGVRQQILALCALPLAFLVALFIAAMSLQRIALASFAAAQHNNALILVVERAYNSLGDMNRAVRELTLHPGAKPLRDYRAARAQAAAYFAAVHRSATNDAVTRDLLRHYASDLDEVTPIIDRFVGYERAHDDRAAKAYAASPAVVQLGSDLLATRASVDQRLISQIDVQQIAFRSRALFLDQVMVGVAGGAIAISLVIAVFFGYRTARRLRRLVENAGHLARREPSTRIGGNDEISDVDRATHELARRLDESLALQLALVPPGLPHAAGLRLDSVYIPAANESRVGGDWYDVFELSDHLVGISIGDVSGHGLPAASTMASLRDAIRVAARRELSPSKTLERVNHTLCMDRPDVLATALFGILDSKSGTFRWAVAGHPPPILIRPDSGLSLLESHGLVLGIDPYARYAEEHTRVDVGAAMIFYTDGLVEVERDYFKGLQTLERAVLDVYLNPAERQPANAIVERVFASALAADDAALLFVGITSIGAPSFERKQTWQLHARDSVSARRVKRAILWKLAGVSAGDPEYAAVELIYGELLANAAMHTPGPLTVTLEERDARALLTFEDHGRPFTPHRDGVPDILSENGRGYWLMSQFAESIAIERVGERNRVTVAVPLVRDSRSSG